MSEVPAGDLVVSGVTLSFHRRPVLRGVDLTVPAGRLTVLFGRTGCGKTTLLRIVGGFLAPDTGTVRIGGRLVCGGGSPPLPPQARRIGYVAQEGALFPHLTVAGNVGFGLPRGGRRAAVAAMLELVGLPGGYAGRRPYELSGGEQQRVALARALARRPELVLLDEPFSSLDPGARAETRRSVLDALAAAGATALLITHDRSEALSIADEVAVLRDGVIAAAGPPAELYRHPADAGLAGLLGELVLVAASVAANAATATCALGRLPVASRPPPRPGPALLMIRPEQLRLHGVGSPSGGDGPAMGVPARVVRTTYFGHDALVELAVGAAGPSRGAGVARVEARAGGPLEPAAADRAADAAGGPVLVSARVPADPLPRPGDRVRLTVAGPVVAFPLSHGALAGAPHRGGALLLPSAP